MLRKEILNLEHRNTRVTRSGAEWTMVDTPRSYAAVSRCRMRARSSAWARRADRPPAYRRGANYRTYISWAPYRGARKRSRAPERCIFNGPPGPGARGSSDATTISETNPLMINKGVRQPLDPASVSRTTCPLNIHELPPRMRHVVGGGKRDVDRGDWQKGLLW